MNRTGLALLVLAGCTGSPAPAPEPASSTPARALTYGEAYSRIQIDGTAQVPLRWTLPEVSDPNAREALLTVQRELALSYYDLSAPNPDEAIILHRYLIMPDDFEEIYGNLLGTGPQQDPSLGPVWVQVYEVNLTAPDRATVFACVDTGFFHDRKMFDANTPRLYRDYVNGFDLVKIIDNNVPRWLIEHHAGVDRRADRYVPQCEAWAATHTTPQG